MSITLVLSLFQYHTEKNHPLSVEETTISSFEKLMVIEPQKVGSTSLETNHPQAYED